VITKVPEAPQAPPLVELRSAVRFPLHLPLTVKSDHQEHASETADISAAGVMFYLESKLDVGAPLEFSIELPPEMVGGAEPVQVKCLGRVARTFEENGRRGVAAIIDEYIFERE